MNKATFQSPQQPNLTDCGVFVLINLHAVVTQFPAPAPITLSQINNIRRIYAIWLLKHYRKPPTLPPPARFLAKPESPQLNFDSLESTPDPAPTPLQGTQTSKAHNSSPHTLTVSPKLVIRLPPRPRSSVTPQILSSPAQVDLMLPVVYTPVSSVGRSPGPYTSASTPSIATPSPDLTPSKYKPFQNTRLRRAIFPGEGSSAGTDSSPTPHARVSKNPVAKIDPFCSDKLLTSGVSVKMTLPIGILKPPQPMTRTQPRRAVKEVQFHKNVHQRHFLKDQPPKLPVHQSSLSNPSPVQTRRQR